MGWCAGKLVGVANIIPRRLLRGVQVIAPTFASLDPRDPGDEQYDGVGLCHETINSASKM